MPREPHAKESENVPMKMTVLLTICVFTTVLASPNDQIEKYNEKVKTYQLDVPGKDPITIIERDDGKISKDITLEIADSDDVAKHLMTHIVHDVESNRPRCYGPSCQNGFNDDEIGPHEGFEDYPADEEKQKDYRDFSKDRLQAINALAAKLKKEKLKADRYSYIDNEEEDENNGKVYTSWNRLKVKQHKHPYDDKDGWVTLEPVAWSTSKISKWKPNVKKQKPNHWNEDEDDRFPGDDRHPSYQEISNGYSYTQKRPTVTRPGYINNKLHVMPVEYESEVPSKPTWNKFQQSSYPSSWSPDEGRRPHKPNCDSEDSNTNDEPYYSAPEALVTDHRPSHFPYEYEALHQATIPKRPFRRPTQVVYAGSPDFDSDRGSRPPHGDGQWVLLSTTKGYRNRKRQRSLNFNPSDDDSNYNSVTSHQAVALTVLPVDNAHTNMTTSHGGLLEVEKTFKTVEESKRDMDKKFDLEVESTQNRPIKTKVIKRKVGASLAPDSSTILAAVGAGMVPATMAMVVPMMLGKRRRRRSTQFSDVPSLDNIYFRYQ